jgi:1-phosphofructokinase family hexose kinase
MIVAVCPNPSVDTVVNFNHFKRGEVNRVVDEQFFPGGKGTNVAKCIKELGEEVMLLGFWAGPTGKWIKQQLEKRGIDCIGPEIEGWTRSCYTYRTNDDFNETEVLGVGPVIDKNALQQFYHLFDEALKGASLVTMSGSWPRGTPDDGYALLIESARQQNIPVVMDSAGKQFARGFEARPSAIHLNKKETAQFTGVQNIRGMLLKLADKVDVAAVTDGKRGLYLMHGHQILHGHLSLENIHGAVGSGDALTAGLCVSMYHGYDDVATTRLAVACGAANCLHEEIGMFYKKDVEKFSDKVIVEDIKMKMP